MLLFKYFLELILFFEYFVRYFFFILLVTPNLPLGMAPSLVPNATVLVCCVALKSISGIRLQLALLYDSLVTQTSELRVLFHCRIVLVFLYSTHPTSAARELSLTIYLTLKIILSRAHSGTTLYHDYSLSVRYRNSNSGIQWLGWGLRKAVLCKLSIP